MADEDSSDLSSIDSLSPPPSEDESEIQNGLFKYFPKLPREQKPIEKQRNPSPEPPKREPSPPHEYSLADNPDIAFLVMFRSRFASAFPKTLPNFGPQELEYDVSEPQPGQRVESMLCAILSLLLNRKNDVKPGQHTRALEDALSTHKGQWPKEWLEKSPLSGGNTFNSMSPIERLTLLKMLVLWTLSSSETVKGIINNSYKNRHEDDMNIPLSVQPWGSDSDKRRYFLIEGLDDTAFRVYRESNPAGFNRTWWSVAGSIEELNALIDKLTTTDTGPKAKKLAQKMMAAIPRFEATEEKRRRREYRQQQKDRFKRPEPGFSVYEGRTRGKRMKYTYSDEEDFLSDSTGARRSTRNTGTHTPAEFAGPVTTASGRQVKAPSRMTVDASNNIVTTNLEQEQGEEDKARATSRESSLGPTGRPKRSAAMGHGTNGRPSSGNRGLNSMDDESDSPSEPELDDDEEEHVPVESEEEEEEDEFNEDEEMAEVEGEGDDDNSPDDPDDPDDPDHSPKSMVVKLKVPNKESVNLDKFRYNGSDSKSPTTAETKPQKEDTAEDVISVAPRKRATPGASTQVASGTTESTTEPAQPSPSSPLATSHQSSLVYRESPEKLQARPPPRPVNIAMGK